MSQRYVPLNNSSHWRFSLIKQKGKSKKIKNREQRRKIFDISKNAQRFVEHAKFEFSVNS